MKLKSPTVLLVGIAAILGLIVFADVLGGGPTADEEGDPIFSFAEDDVQAFTVETPTETLAFEKDDSDTWRMVEPEQAVADDASVAFLLNLLATGTRDRTLTVTAAELGEYGLDTPQASIAVELENQDTHELILGDYDFNQQFLFAQIESGDESAESQPEGEVEVLLVPAAFDTAVNRPVEEWQQSEAGATTPEAIPEAPLETIPDLETVPELNPEPLPEPE